MICVFLTLDSPLIKIGMRKPSKGKMLESGVVVGGCVVAWSAPEAGSDKMTKNAQ